MLTEVRYLNQIHNSIPAASVRTFVITIYYGSGSARQKVAVPPTVPFSVSQHCQEETMSKIVLLLLIKILPTKKFTKNNVSNILKHLGFQFPYHDMSFFRLPNIL